MKSYICPHCAKKTINTICDNCKMDILNANSLSPLIRKLKLAVILKDRVDILKYANLILDQDKFYFYAQYHKAFINYLDGNKEELNNLISEKTNSFELEEIINHMLVNNVNEEQVKKFIRLNCNNNFEVNKTINNDTINTLFNSTTLRFHNLEDQRVRNQKTLITSGLIVWVVFSLILLLFNNELRYIYTMLFLIFPSYLISKGLVFSLFKKNISRFLLFIIIIFILSILSFISLIDIQKGIVYHLKQVFTFPYEFIRYYVKKVIINI